MTRWNLGRLAWLATLVLLFGAPPEAAAQGAAKDKKPNILILWGDDIGYWNEITESPTHEPFEALHRALRSGPVPWRQLIADCNPNRPDHWVLGRVKKGLCTRITTRLEDNPAYHDGRNWTRAGLEYRSRLGRNLTGVQRKRLFEGIWCVSSGLLLPTFAANEHVFRIPQPPWRPGWRRACMPTRRCAVARPPQGPAAAHVRRAARGAPPSGTPSDLRGQKTAASPWPPSVMALSVKPR